MYANITGTKVIKSTQAPAKSIHAGVDGPRALPAQKRPVSAPAGGNNNRAQTLARRKSPGEAVAGEVKATKNTATSTGSVMPKKKTAAPEAGKALAGDARDELQADIDMDMGSTRPPTKVARPAKTRGIKTAQPSLKKDAFGAKTIPGAGFLQGRTGLGGLAIGQGKGGTERRQAVSASAVAKALVARSSSSAKRKAGNNSNKTAGARKSGPAKAPQQQQQQPEDMYLDLEKMMPNLRLSLPVPDARSYTPDAPVSSPAVDVTSPHAADNRQPKTLYTSLIDPEILAAKLRTGYER